MTVKLITYNENESYNLLGLAALQQGHLEEAQEFLQRAISLNPNSIGALGNLGNVFFGQRKFSAAIACYQQVLALNPNDADTYNNLGKVFTWLGQFTEARDCYQQAIAISPDYAEAHYMLGDIFNLQGHLTQAIAHYSCALATTPADVKGHSNFLTMLNYVVEYDQAAIFLEHRKFDERHALPLATFIKPLLRPQTNGPRRLKLGYLSADFHHHPVTFFMAPVLANHDHAQFEIFCYYNFPHGDEVTDWVQQAADHFVKCFDLSDEVLAEQIRRDEIDILVELTGHFAKNRLPVLARRPAPIQVIYLGYPTSTGLSAIDYRITDNYVDPEGQTEAFNSEALVRMPHSYFCYQAPANCPPVGPLPGLQQGYLVVGSLNNYAKLSPQILTLWAQLLRKVTHAKLLIKAKILDDPSTRQTLMEHFKRFGIGPERLILRGWLATMMEQLSLYNEVDIALDSFPYNGATTTCEALWMGVPVVTLVGDRHVSRMGLSILSALGLTELVAYTPEEYMTVCLNLANNIGYLQYLRETLRGRMQTSPLMDGVSFTRHLEAAYQRMFLPDWRL
jgi:predicted O-linked N-acetylglucosamine transferase (SPINDLY family)